VDILLLYNNHLLPNVQEGNFLGTPLLQPLDAGKKYNVVFYLSLMDSMRIACKNIGVHFSTGRPDGNLDSLLSLEPQIRYVGDFLIDKEGWMEVSGSFTAQGGEDFITIGNFDGYINSDTLNLHDGGVLPNIGYWETAAYFMDHVTVVEDRNIGMDEAENDRFTLYPNPATEAFIIEAEHGRVLRMYDMAGRLVLHDPLHSREETVSIGHLRNGIYLVAVEMQDGNLVRQRLVKQW